MTVASTIFSLAEILQQVLSELPPLDIIKCRRVNSFWQRLIDDSPLLQYKSWLRNDYPDPAHHVSAYDLMPELDRYAPGYHWEDEANAEYETRRFYYNVSKHLNPIVVACIAELNPTKLEYWFSPIDDMKEAGFGGYMHFPPSLLRALMQWRDRNKSSQHVWGNMSLYRPNARKVRWEIPTSGGAGIPFHLEAVRNDDRGAETYSSDYIGNEVLVNKVSGKPLNLTLNDLMGRLDVEWERWIDSEHEEHYLSHDGGVCDFEMGIPGEGCLESDDGEDDEDDDEEDCRRETSGCKLTMEEHIEQAIEAASGL